jgi:hypothetical protein
MGRHASGADLDGNERSMLKRIAQVPPPSTPRRTTICDSRF